MGTGASATAVPTFTLLTIFLLPLIGFNIKNWAELLNVTIEAVEMKTSERKVVLQLSNALPMHISITEQLSDV